MDIEYSEQLKDPRWIFKRKIILDRDGHKCTECGSKRHLNVHHTYYSGGYLAWEYPDDSLVTLCEVCHEEWHKAHEIVWKEHPDGKPSRKRKPKPKRRPRPKRDKGRNKKRKRHGHLKRRPRICLAEIQAHKEDYIKLDDGTWIRKK